MKLIFGALNLLLYIYVKYTRFLNSDPPYSTKKKKKRVIHSLANFKTFCESVYH